MLRNHHINARFKRLTRTYCIIKNEYEFAFLQYKVYFHFESYENLKAESVCKRIIIYITGFQTFAAMHDPHYIKTKILPHTNCEHIKDMLSLQPANQHNNS